MKTCPQCLQKVEDLQPVCGFCGHEVSDPAVAATGDPQQGASTKSDAQKTAAPAPRAWGLNNVRLVLILVALVALAAAVLTGLRTQREATDPAADVTRKNGGPGELHAIPPEPGAPSATKWTGSRQAGWARDGSRMISFVLDAETTVPVWMKRVRPVLAVRCLQGNTEVFVVTQSAASIEPTAELHTVQLAFDKGSTLTERWLEADDSQALFAPDGVGVARRMAHSRLMHFGFTPFNASPVTVQFNVNGFDALVGLVAKTCRWKP